MHTLDSPALHAAVLGFHHATTGEYRQWEAPLPADMQELLQLLGQDDA